jgi:hypothetical protein
MTVPFHHFFNTESEIRAELNRISTQPDGELTYSEAAKARDLRSMLETIMRARNPEIDK